jgi:predicted aldo/keto reductase-like oxidoreductase
MKEDDKISRRDALKYMGVTALGLVVAGAGVDALAGNDGVAGIGGGNQSDDQGLQVDKRTDPKSGVVNSLLGFGCMRFPQTGDGKIDEPLATKMIDYAYAHGVNYFDTAWMYHNGESETFIGKTLKKYPRETFHLTTKMPSPNIKNLDDAKKIFAAQLQKCQVDYFDYYLLHTLYDEKMFHDVYEDGGVLDWLLEQKKAGVIRRLGFSFHGTVDFLKYLMENHEWDVVQIQCNYYDWEGEENSKEKYEIITAHNTPVIVMEPIRGGMLANPNPDARDLMKKAEPKASPSSWALRYVASLPNVMVILSGMSAMEHVQDNIRTLSNFKPLTDAERGILAQALVYIKGAPLIRCTGCHYCMPCPFGVDIPGNFAVYNDLVNEKLIPYLDQKGTPDYERRKRAFFNYYSKMEDKTLYDRCVKCGRCMRLCPQHIRIPQELQKIRTLSDGLKATEAKV